MQVTGKHAKPKYSKGTLVDTSGLGRLQISGARRLRGTDQWLYTFDGRDDILLGESMFTPVEMEKRIVAVEFKAQFRHLVEVTVPVDQDTELTHSIAEHQAAIDMAPYVEQGFPDAMYLEHSYETLNLSIESRDPVE